jgi:hypothetical protein
LKIISRFQTLCRFGKYIDSIIKKRDSENNKKSLVETKAELQNSIRSLSRVMSVHNTISRDNSFIRQLQTDDQSSIASHATPISQTSSITMNCDGTIKVLFINISNQLNIFIFYF